MPCDKYNLLEKRELDFHLHYNSFIMLVDPRPFTYQYRKPRLLNPTYQSRGLYESLYHRYPNEYNDYYPQQQQKQIVRYDSYDRNQKNHSEKKDFQRKMTDVPKANTQNLREEHQTSNKNPERQKEGYKLPSLGRDAQRNKVFSSFDNNVNTQGGDSLAIKNRRGFERFRIYQRQQKPYNIISCYPKQRDDNELRLFPKLTLEDRLIQRGSYHTLRQQ